MNNPRFDPQNDTSGLVSMHDAGAEGCRELGFDPCTDHIVLETRQRLDALHPPGTVGWLRGLLAGYPEAALVVAAGVDHVRRVRLEIGVLCRSQWSPESQVLTLADEQRPDIG